MRRPVPAALLSIAVAASTTLGAAGASAAADADPASTGIPAVTMPSGAGAPASDDPAGRVAPGLLAAEGEVSAFVELAAPSALDVTERGGDAAAVERAARHVEDLAASVVPTVAGEDEPSGATSPERLSVTTNVVAGAVVRGDARSVRELAAAPGVVGLHRIVPKRVGNVASNVLTRTLAAWRSTGGTGEGVRVGVVDTGLDYTHAHFGGPGTVEAYADAYGTDGTGPVPADATDPAKYLGGHDFAGPTYDASGRTPGSTRTPRPDANPIDPRWSGAATAGHGTHVTGIGFGYGVLPDGTTFRGDHDALTDLSGWQVGPGSAPRAGVYALKVFGDAGGTTELVLPALDWAMDPDGDGDVSDHLDVVNLSLGENFLPADDPESLFVDRLAEVGVLTVLGAGGTSDQPGDAADTIGAPGNARSGLTVANSIGDARLLDSVEVTRAPDPDAVGTHPAQSSTAYAGDDDVEAPVVFLGDDVTGCAPLTRYADRVAGAVLWLSWDDSAQRECGSGVRFDHAQAAGAVGVLVGTELSDFPVKLGGNGAIPGAQLSAAATDLLLPQIRTGDVTVRLGPSLRETSYVVDESLQDTLSGDSPRGVHGSLGVVKPDVAAPGAAILSARSGTGTGDGPLSGTSMAAPHVAGIAALVRAAHPDWTAAQVKAAVMNTATHDVHLDQRPLSPVHGPLRVGSGRVDAADAVRTTTLAWATEDPAQVSVSFGVVPVGAEPVRRRTTVTVENTGDRPVEYRTSVALATTSGGATITASPEVLTVRPGARELVTLTLDADPATLRKEPDPTSERIGPSGAPAEFLTAVSGRLVLSAPDAELRVPVVAAPRLVSDLTAEPVTFATAGAATAPLELTGRGVAAGGWTSLLAPMQLVATSPRLDLATGAVAAPSAVASGDLRAVGFASTVPQRSADDPTGSRALIGVGIATHGSWANLGSGVTLQVDTDVDGDGATDFHTRVVKFGAGDLTVARTYRAGPTPTWLQDLPVNTVLGDVDTTVFDSDVVVVPISVAALGLTPGTTPTMTVSSWSQYAPDPSGRIDATEPFTVDPFHPQYWFDGGTPGSLLFRAAPGTPVSVHRRAVPGAPAPQLLVLHLHNATTAARAQVVDVVAPVATPTTTTLTVTGTPAVGSPLTLTATVTPAGAAGTVEHVAADGTVLASAPVRDGVATAPVRLGGGEHQVTARFVPADAQWAASASAPVTVVVPQAASTVRLRLSDRAISYGDPTTATVQVSAGAGVPSGTVRLVVAGAVVGTGTVVVDADDPTTGTAVVDLPRDLPVGGHRVTASYTGSADVAPSSTDVRLRIVPAAPALTLTAPSWTVRPGSTPTVTVTVAGAAGAPAPTGRVTVLVNLRRVGTADLGPDGRVAVTLPPLDRRAVVTAVYGGDQGYRPDVDVRAMRVR